MPDTFLTADGLVLRTRVDLPVGRRRARIVLVHGIGDQVDGLPYRTAAEAFAQRGFVVHRLELRGHGESGGRRMYVASWADFRNDLGAFLASVAEPPRATFVVGVSMGGLIVTNYAALHPQILAGVIAVAPALGDTGGSRFLLALLPILSRLIPRVRLDAGLDLSRVTRDTTLQAAYVGDPLYQRRVTPRIASELLATIRATRELAPQFSVPLLILHGTADPITSPSGSRAFFDAAGVRDKTYVSYDGAYHQLFLETNREEVYDDIAAWIIAHTADTADPRMV